MKGGELTVSGGSFVESTLIATWTIVLIVGFGGFTLNALMMDGFLPVYRRS